MIVWINILYIIVIFNLVFISVIHTSKRTIHINELTQTYGILCSLAKILYRQEITTSRSIDFEYSCYRQLGNTTVDVGE